MERRHFLALAAASALISPVRTAAAEMDEVILDVTGQLDPAHGPSLSLDRGAIEALGLDVVTTHTPWNEGRTRFEGVRLSRLLDHVGATGSTLRLTALNDYTVEMGIGIVREFEPLLAIKADGAYLTARTNGPVFVLFDFDGNPATDTPKHHALSVWQLRTIAVS